MCSIDGNPTIDPHRRRPVPILGTSITLDTAEDIEAWIAERKQRWPSVARVAEKKRKIEEAIASGGLLPDHLMSKRPRLPFNAEGMRTGRGRSRGGNRGGRGQGRGMRGAYITAPNRHQPPPPPPPPPPPLTTLKTEPRQCVPTATDSTSSSDTGSDSDAPEVLSAKRPPGIEAYESSSSDVESERRQIADVPPCTAHVPSNSKADPCPGGGGVTATAAAVSCALPPTVPSASARPTDVSRRAPPPQPKKPPQNPFGARTSLLRSVSEPISCRL